jgi:hypothetical protein
MAKTSDLPVRFRDLFPENGIALHIDIFNRAWMQTNAMDLFHAAESWARLGLARDNNEDFERSYYFLRRAAQELLTFPQCAQFCGMTFVFPRLLELLHDLIHPNDPPLKLLIFVEQLSEDVPLRITVWHDGTPEVEGLASPEALEWLSRYLKWAGPTLRGEPIGGGGRQAKALGNKQRNFARRARKLADANEPITRIATEAKVSERTIYRWIDRLKAEDNQKSN